MQNRSLRSGRGHRARWFQVGGIAGGDRVPPLDQWRGLLRLAHVEAGQKVNHILHFLVRRQIHTLLVRSRTVSRVLAGVTGTRHGHLENLGRRFGLVVDAAGASRRRAGDGEASAASGAGRSLFGELGGEFGNGLGQAARGLAAVALVEVGRDGVISAVPLKLDLNGGKGLFPDDTHHPYYITARLNKPQSI